ncbi:PACE efflux transporter [Iodobacter sp. CM08]|uniref:PACE efflux transporter n=1 Tax=Iodobacter sp. CM08 TaxID=3085902 RepID=UPI0029817BA4|nr:PACE efflux transporter [Iodobacter sp. CM08]MDW5416112.1 PACE efflux transporter [Iodobacter sp. CM08]
MQMRNRADRIRHVIGFEVIGLLLFIPLAKLAFGFSVGELGVLAVAISIIATVWNYVYNLGFDHLLARWKKRVNKTPVERVVHAIGFEGGLLLVSLPLVAWWLKVGLWDAFIMDLGFAAFYLVYAFIYNWVYDKVFPLPVWKAA